MPYARADVEYAMAPYVDVQAQTRTAQAGGDVLVDVEVALEDDGCVAVAAQPNDVSIRPNVVARRRAFMTAPPLGQTKRPINTTIRLFGRFRTTF